MRDKGKIIGGEFEISPELMARGNFTLPAGTYFSSGRAALFHILSDLKNRGRADKLLLPDYLCVSVYQAAVKAGMEISYYPVGDDLRPDSQMIRSLSGASTAVLLINYFGLVDPGPAILELKSGDNPPVVITDNVMAYGAMDTPDGADYSFTSLRKQFPVPDGAWILSKEYGPALTTEIPAFPYLKLAGSVMKGQREDGVLDDSVYLGMLSRAEEMIDDDYGTAMSEVSRLIMSNIDTTDCARKRRRNALYLSDGLAALGIRPVVPVGKGMTPLFLPVLLEERDRVRQELAAENIFCPVHWPCFDPELAKSRYMAGHELSLVVDQRYGTGEMDRILDVLKRCMV